MFVPLTLTAHSEKLGKFTETKNIQKSFSVNSDALLDIENKYGSIFITTWNENRTEIQVVIKVSSDDEKWTQKRISEIEVEMSHSASNIRAITVFENSNYSSGKNNSIDVAYIIKMPKNGKVKLYQKYGDIMTQDLQNESHISCKYGKITLGKLKHSANQIFIDYCNSSTIEHIQKGKVTAKYSGLQIQSYDDLNLDTAYTDVNVGSGNKITFQNKYGKLTTETIHEISGNGGYMTLKIKKMTGNLDFIGKYSKLYVDEITGNAGDIKVDASYTNVQIFYAINFPFDAKINLRYGNLKKDDALESYNVTKTNTSLDFQGYYLKRNSNKIQISSNYGNVTLKSL